MKKKINVKFHSRFYELNKNMIVSILNSFCDCFISENHYDYYFVDDAIYFSLESRTELLNSNPNAIRFFFCGEAFYPDVNLFDYSINLYNFDLKCKDRFLYLPYYNTYLLSHELFERSVKELDSVKGTQPEYEILQEKNKFCNFIYGNSNAHHMRDLLFYEISKYKIVDSLGRHLNNVEIKNTRMDKNWANLSVELKRPYKFSIAAENAKFPGYTSEKLLTSMMANTIPIYFGNPSVAECFNPKSFINVSDYDSIDKLVERIREIDENDDLWCEIMSQPWRTPEQIENFENDTKTFYEKFYNIFELDLRDAKKRPEGTWPDFIYPKFLLDDREDPGLKKYFVNWLKKKICTE